MATLVNGRYPDAEVIVTFGDGWSYSKTKMEQFRAAGGFEKLKEPQTQKEKPTGTVVPKKEDVKKLMSEMEISKSLAESALVAVNGDLKAAFEWLIYGPASETTTSS
ncbi:hypothetical protein FRC14_004432 [Serendipita sp. 396]|nr:hypothetical protein FRC14_004432 [Serendipita sp. 396]KAG8827139.1 hypothetical protein FRC19_005273 [Serendipita sp. 401]KAG8837074.1 hypothetical protein FRC18_010094 [Serendipita sp. 400]KAG8859660.1 hypothetical protein FRB91_007084 [Serendipita sp. 411]KAG8872160.1 hypothetical protein FRC20_009722 [Serendipita sp. 405]